MQHFTIMKKHLRMSSVTAKYKDLLRDKLRTQYEWYRQHVALLMGIIFLHALFIVGLQLPYINWFKTPLKILIVLFDWILIVRTTHMSIPHVIYIAFFFFIVAALFSFAKITGLAEQLGQLTYGILLFAVIMLAINQIKEP